MRALTRAVSDPLHYKLIIISLPSIRDACHPVKKGGKKGSKSGARHKAKNAALSKPPPPPPQSEDAKMELGEGGEAAPLELQVRVERHLSDSRRRAGLEMSPKSSVIVCPLVLLVVSDIVSFSVKR